MILEALLIDGKEVMAQVTQIGKHYIIKIDGDKYICEKRKGEYFCEVAILK